MVMLGSGVNALDAVQLEAWKKLYDGTGGASWSYCSDKKEDPCGCTYSDWAGTGGVKCVGEDITEINIYSANLQGKATFVYESFSGIFYIVLDISCQADFCQFPLFHIG